MRRYAPTSPAMVVLIRHLRRVKLLAREVKKRIFSVAGIVTQLAAFGYSAPKYVYQSLCVFVSSRTQVRTADNIDALLPKP